MRNIMRYFYTIFFILFLTVSNGQSFVTYKDTINHFMIDIPVGWRYGISKNYPSLKLRAYRTPDSLTDTSKDNYNLNILQTPNLTLDETYSKFLESIKEADNCKLVYSGDTNINGKKFKWLVETHTNEIDKIQMHNYDFVTYQNDKTYILTFTTFSKRFEIVKPTFNRISSSFFLTE